MTLMKLAHVREHLTTQGNAIPEPTAPTIREVGCAGMLASAFCDPGKLPTVFYVLQPARWIADRLAIGGWRKIGERWETYQWSKQHATWALVGWRNADHAEWPARQWESA